LCRVDGFIADRKLDHVLPPPWNGGENLWAPLADPKRVELQQCKKRRNFEQL
jgi:hypothetical protein